MVGEVPEGPVGVTTRAIVRQGIAQFFGGSNYSTLDRAYLDGPLSANGLAVVRRAEPKRESDAMFNFGLSPGRQAGAQMIVELGPQTERRDQVGGAIGGRKRISYLTLLNIFHRSLFAHSEDATDDLDGLLEAIYDLIRNDKTLGGSCVQAGETNYGIRTSPPALDMANNRVDTYVAVSFEADVEIVA